jgi:head-tail adaptor
MSTRKVTRRRLKKYAVGDMRNRIGLYKRDIKSPGFQSSKFQEEYTLITKVWAFVATLNLGEIVFDNVRIKSKSGNFSTKSISPSHKFVIRYRSDITSETRILWRDKYYEIIPTINPEERNQYLELYSVLVGSKDLEANE